MQRTSWRDVVALLSVAMLIGPLGSQATHAGSTPGVFPPQAHPYGDTYHEWAKLAWKAVLDDPFDPASCIEGRDGDVLFLQTSGGAPLTLDCSVPAGKSLLFAVVSGVFLCPFDCGPGTLVPNGTEEELAAAAQGLLDLTSLLEVTVDGAVLGNLEEYRFLTPAFSGVADPDNVFGAFGVVGPYGPAMADGFWLMLPPLAAGEHEIHVRAEVGTPPFFVAETTHHITVEP